MAIKLKTPIAELSPFTEKHKRNTAKRFIKLAQQLIDQHFDDRQASWKKLAQYTIRQRLALGFGATPILEQTGLLRKNASNVQIVTIQKHKLIIRIGSDDDRAVDHEYGNPAKRLPARPFIAMSEKDEIQLAKTI